MGTLPALVRDVQVALGGWWLLLVLVQEGRVWRWHLQGWSLLVTRVKE